MKHVWELEKCHVWYWKRIGKGEKGEENCRCDCLARCQRDWGMTGMLGALKKALNPSNNGRGAVKSRQKARKYKYVNT